jgi:molybdopterin synthase catalytic subunit/molybdopterin synthase sulfur carrier subunit
VKVRFLLWLAEKAGKDGVELDIKDTSETALHSVLLELARSKPQLSRVVEDILLGKSDVIILVNLKTPSRGLETPIREGDEIALMPPVSGG